MALTQPRRRSVRHRHAAPPPPPPATAVAHDPEHEVQRLCQELNDAGYVAEISWGQVVVSPKVNRAQSNITFRLMKQLFPLVAKQEWVIHSNWGVHIPPYPDMRIPDLMVAPEDARQYDDMHIRGDSALLVAEVCSRGTYAVDWDEKPLEYARAGVPLLLIVDPVSDPPTVTMMTGPVRDLAPDDGREPYKTIVMAESGRMLELPEPFGVKVDTTALFG